MPIARNLKVVISRAGAVSLALAACAFAAPLAVDHSSSQAELPWNAKLGPYPDLPAFTSRDLTPNSKAEALAANAARPTVPNGLEKPPPFGAFAQAASSPSYSSALDCLTQAVYYEAAGEPLEGQRAVAQVVLNRVRHPAFPASICEVVYQGSQQSTGCQFTFTCDGSLLRKPSRPAWDNARRVATAALSGAIEPAVGMATHYHADWILPHWTPQLDKLSTVGAHIFYRWKGYWGRRQAFSQSYSGEPAGGLAALVSATESLVPLEEGVTTSIAVAANRQHPPSATDQMEAGRLLAPDEKVARPLADERHTLLVADERRSQLRSDSPRIGGL